MTTEQPTIIKVTQVTPELLALLRSDAKGPCHIVTTCAVLHIPGPDPDSEHGACVGHCPACHLPVFEDEPDGPVWTCPADLLADNPHQQPADERITEELMERTGAYSNCGEDFGFECYERMPLHGMCYGSAVLTY